ncbi:acyltransferase family protein [Agrobacterium sp. CNPSo 3708]|uniref:acyltransferase family protein n=1 Tax=Agrobacterium sp. CNPSo 3708 TaxID=3028150 RepID=UPI0023649B4C|nr:acyltransferase family protein [Agrobacterium sp. CNPSo 3708]MDD1499822.1 acyltransferase family protein [Agrobacterium sp. CNPSo 3708]
MLTSNGYRPEIDGLRALAVLPVLFFHANLPGFSGGFVGVDVFFVISGYLITAKIYGDLKGGNFKFLDFYERRARRILPLLLCVIAACMPLAFFIFNPGDFSRFASSIPKILELKAEVYFRKTGGYFDAVDYPRPLLHTWSLSIEEKYYIVFPIIFGFVFGRWRHRLGGTLIGATLAFLFLSVILTAIKPAGSYYMFWARIWEILIGANVALFAPYLSAVVRPRARSAATWASVATLGGCIYLFDETVAYPGVLSVIPSLSACLLILFTTRVSLLGRALSSRPAIFTGLLSYSIYMWHLPAFVIAEEAGLFSDPTYKAAVIGAVFAVSYLSWRYIETPFRRQSAISTKQFLTVMSGSICLILLASSMLKDVNDKRVASVTPRHTNDSLKLEECLLYKESRFSATCHLDDAKKSPQVLLIGDSHAAAVYSSLKSWASTRGFELKPMTATYCLPLITGFPENRSETATKRCEEINKQVLQEIDSKKPDLIILAAYMYQWSAAGGSIPVDERWSYPSYFSDFRAALSKLTKEHRVIVLGQVPVWKKFLPELVAQELGVFQSDLKRIPRYSDSGLMDGLFKFDVAYRKTVTEAGAEYVSVLDALCKDSKCPRYEENERGLPELSTADYGHLSKPASDHVVSSVLGPQLDKILVRSAVPSADR